MRKNIKNIAFLLAIISMLVNAVDTAAIPMENISESTTELATESISGNAVQDPQAQPDETVFLSFLGLLRSKSESAGRSFSASGVTISAFGK